MIRPRVPGATGTDDWVRVEDGNEVTVDLVPGKRYAIGVRAVDEAGAVEPFLAVGRNVVLLSCQPGADRPVLFISEPNLGRFTFTAADPDTQRSAPAGLAFDFAWSASAEAYGGRIDELRLGRRPRRAR